MNKLSFIEFITAYEYLNKEWNDINDEMVIDDKDMLWAVIVHNFFNTVLSAKITSSVGKEAIDDILYYVGLYKKYLDGEPLD